MKQIFHSLVGEFCFVLFCSSIMFPKDHVFMLNQNQNQYFLFLLLPKFLKNRSGEVSSISNIATDSFKVVFDLVHLVEFPSGLNQ